MSQLTITPVTAETLISQVANKLQQGCRFVTMTCLSAEGGCDILYHFDKNYQLSSLRLHVVEGDSVPSITGQYLAAVLAENEIRDFFGLSFQGIAIDFKGRLLLTEDAPRTPLSKNYGIGVDVVRDKPQPQPGKGASA